MSSDIIMQEQELDCLSNYFPSESINWVVYCCLRATKNAPVGESGKETFGTLGQILHDT